MSPSPPYRILYIEDDPQVSDLFRMAIEERGGSVDVAADGKDGLAKHFADPYDVVVTDYRLPDMTGLDVAGALLADNEDLPVIMVTGKGNERIAADDIPKILQPFGQVKNAYVNNTREGSGLGLPLVKSLIEIHGGTIEIDSAPGEGTRVSVTFPPDRTIAAP